MSGVYLCDPGYGHQSPLDQGGAQADQALPRHTLLHRRSVTMAPSAWDWLVYIWLGIHPHDAKSWDEETCSEIREAARWVHRWNVFCVNCKKCFEVCWMCRHRRMRPRFQQKLFSSRNPDWSFWKTGEIFNYKQASLKSPNCNVLPGCVGVWAGKTTFPPRARRSSADGGDSREICREVLTKSYLIVFQILHLLPRLPPCVIHCFTGNREQAQKYLQLGCYIGLTGYLWKDKSENGVRKILEDGVIPLDKLLVETDAPFMYPNTRASKLPQHIKDCLTEKSVTFLQRYCTFQVAEKCIPRECETYFLDSVMSRAHCPSRWRWSRPTSTRRRRRSPSRLHLTPSRCSVCQDRGEGDLIVRGC